MELAIGKLLNIAVRDVWPYEDEHFTPWLSKPDNLNLLGETLGLGQIDLQGTEVAVGNCALDILGRDASGRAVLIENQFGPSDHSHLGQLLTYLAGQSEEVIIV